MKKGICSSTLQGGGAVVCNFKERLKDLGGVQRIPRGWEDRPLCHLPALPARQELAVIFSIARSPYDFRKTGQSISNGRQLQSESLRRHQDTDWSEPWILTLVFFHVVCLFFTYLSFRHYRFQIGLFLCLIILVFCAEYINEAAAANWRFFSKHQYFDSQGMFISLVFSVPLLLNAILIVIAWVYKTVNVMTELKTIQQKRKARREEKKSQ